MHLNKTTLVIYKHIKICIWLCRVLFAAAGSLLFTEACEIFSCGMQTLSCGMWDLVPWPKMEPWPSASGVQGLSHWTQMSPLKHYCT